MRLAANELKINKNRQISEKRLFFFMNLIKFCVFDRIRSELMFTLLNHKISEIPFFNSPFHNDRPKHEISLLVIHSISLPEKKYDTNYVQKLFMNEIDPNENELCAEISTYKVSAHLFIRRTGEIMQFVAFDKRAWHAGLSSFLDRDDCNDFSIGIELEGCETDYFTLEQYKSLAKVTQLLCHNYPINSIVGHEHIAPDRKRDPGLKFNWFYYQQLLGNSANLFSNLPANLICKG